MRAEGYPSARRPIAPARAAAPAALLWLAVAALLLVAGTWAALRSGSASAVRRSISSVTVPPPPPAVETGDSAGAYTVRDPARAHDAATLAEPPAMLMREQLRKMQEYAEKRGAGDPLAPTPAAIEEFRRRDNPYVW